MILVRDVFQCKYGKGDELVALFKEAGEKWPERLKVKIMTDISGQFFTVVTEEEVENLAAWEKRFDEILAIPDFGEWFGRMTPLVEKGHREFYNIVD
ncbi:MAG: hypothetical protein FVQ83_13665 [Chloroflexi bacterium]|nr:hypothetical protein [Chloroflexota bacterium]